MRKISYPVQYSTLIGNSQQAAAQRQLERKIQQAADCTQRRPLIFRIQPARATKVTTRQDRSDRQFEPVLRPTRLRKQQRRSGVTANLSQFDPTQFDQPLSQLTIVSITETTTNNRQPIEPRTDGRTSRARANLTSRQRGRRRVTTKLSQFDPTNLINHFHN